MPKLRVLNSKQVIKLLLENGFVEDRQSGSHKIFIHSKKKLRVVVPVHSKDLPKGTLKSILKSAGLE